jgi:pimeloyl-ACP methyl ester carboxylesterase
MNALTTIRTANRVVGTIAPRLTAEFARKLLMTPHPRDAREYEAGALEHAERITFRFGLAGLRWGHSGPVVLAMHGWEGRPTQFACFVEPLLAAGRQVIALEAPAHGRSPGREAHPFAFTEALLEAAAEIKDLESVLGHSMGGSAALYAVSQGLSARRAVTIGSPAALSRALQRFADRIALPGTARGAFVDVVDRHVGVGATELDAAKLARRLRIETLIVHDRDDREVPYAEAQAWAAAWPSARFLTTQGLGHSRILADPTVIQTAVRFLTGWGVSPQLRAV